MMALSKLDANLVVNFNPRSTNLFARENIKGVYVKSRRETHTERGGVDRRAAWPLPEGRMVQNSAQDRKEEGGNCASFVRKGSSQALRPRVLNSNLWNVSEQSATALCFSH